MPTTTAFAFAALIALLDTSKPVIWVERVGEEVQATARLGTLFDDTLQRRLMSGLTTTLELELELVRHDDDVVMGRWQRTVRVRWDLWSEALCAERAEPGHAGREQFPNAHTFYASFATAERVALAAGVPLDPTVYEVRAALRINPLSSDEVARMRQWLSDDASDDDFDPIGRGLFGSFVRLFENLKPLDAERTLRAAGRPFRGDRLPIRKTAPHDGE